MNNYKQDLSIRIPSDWTPPKYYFGQRVKQGQITGVEYHPPGTQIAYELGKGWVYRVLRNELCETAEIFIEKDIKPLTAQELEEKIQAEIEFHASKVTALAKQLEEVQQA
ncbi:MAG: hypothetical protein RM049_23445 [Nostoc sp. DedQUE04]|uniref:hypothetical protein n=1 Tax=Nostoc sp. DedQUE04 TaxID=3075390 RepID=UPI002AD3755D|nr:hypothetical protein [Nostoc sp. DedQUE04]MDZ8138225.1 hypothetical protein [Nostoc sp. DedQUE04]